MARVADPTKSRQYRVDHGLCPECGKEAAPYYLCWDCRSLGMISRLLNTMTKRGITKKEKINGRQHFSVEPGWENRCDQFSWHPCGPDLKADDKRRRPRLGRRPVDLDETLMSIFIAAGNRGLSENEIVTAWGRLRTKRKTESLAGDMAAIIKAQRRREERAARNRMLMEKQKECAA